MYIHVNVCACVCACIDADSGKHFLRLGGVCVHFFGCMCVCNGVYIVMYVCMHVCKYIVVYAHMVCVCTYGVCMHIWCVYAHIFLLTDSDDGITAHHEST